jgi:hypothetical protein
MEEIAKDCAEELSDDDEDSLHAALELEDEEDMTSSCGVRGSDPSASVLCSVSGTCPDRSIVVSTPTVPTMNNVTVATTKATVWADRTSMMRCQRGIHLYYTILFKSNQ